MEVIAELLINIGIAVWARLKDVPLFVWAVIIGVTLGIGIVKLRIYSDLDKGATEPSTVLHECTGDDCNRYTVECIRGLQYKVPVLEGYPIKPIYYNEGVHSTCKQEIRKLDY